MDVRTGPRVQRATASIRNTASLQPGEVRGRAVAAMARACKGGQEALLGFNGRRREERGPTGLAASQRSASRAASFFSEFAPGGCLVLGCFFFPLLRLPEAGRGSLASPRPFVRCSCCRRRCRCRRSCYRSGYNKGKGGGDGGRGRGRRWEWGPRDADAASLLLLPRDRDRRGVRLQVATPPLSRPPPLPRARRAGRGCRSVAPGAPCSVARRSWDCSAKKEDARSGRSPSHVKPAVGLGGPAASKSSPSSKTAEKSKIGAVLTAFIKGELEENRNALPGRSFASRVGRLMTSLELPEN